MLVLASIATKTIKTKERRQKWKTFEANIHLGNPREARTTLFSFALEQQINYLNTNQGLSFTEKFIPYEASKLI